ncbi:MAG: response regulator [Ferruginibacter sp.]
MREKVLIIDDDSRNTFALSAVLAAKGYVCICAADMLIAFDLLQTNTDIEIILIDMMMPDMDGYEALPMLKADQRYKQIPVIAVTAQAMKGDKEKCLSAGADNYIAKPVNIDALLQMMNQY